MLQQEESSTASIARLRASTAEAERKYLSPSHSGARPGFTRSHIPGSGWWARVHSLTHTRLWLVGRDVEGIRREHGKGGCVAQGRYCHGAAH